MQLYTLLAMLTAAFGVVFALQNSVTISVALLLWSFESSLALILLLTLALGGFIVALVSTPSTIHRQWTIARQSRRIVELERECSEQQRAIAELESRLPVVVPATATTDNARPYGGLKQLIAGGDEAALAPPSAFK
ncbi:MAG TPA: LapA family protein [Rhodocyclaceae bacterium]|nr:LapA family protein [Rhodocyclaceae bacterium]